MRLELRKKDAMSRMFVESTRFCMNEMGKLFVFLANTERERCIIKYGVDTTMHGE